MHFRILSGKCMHLCNPNLCQDKEHYRPPEGSLRHLPANSHFHYPASPLQISFRCSKTLYKWKNTVCSLLCLAFTQHVFDIRPCGCMDSVISFLLTSKSHGLTVPPYIWPLFCWWTLGCSVHSHAACSFWPSPCFNRSIPGKLCGKEPLAEQSKVAHQLRLKISEEHFAHWAVRGKQVAASSPSSVLRRAGLRPG